MSTKKYKIQYAILHNPLLIPTLLNDTSINKGMIFRLLKKAIPCRIGIEFELSGDFRKGFINKYKKGTISTYRTITEETEDAPVSSITIQSDHKSNNEIGNIIAKHYGVFEVRGDEGSGSADSIYEIRCSIKDYSQLKGLYLFMQDLPEFCKLHEGGGIHIHVDISHYPLGNKKKAELMYYITKRLDDVAKIFPKYTGKYNSKRVGNPGKASWVNISNKKSIEYRIAPLTFDYSVLIQWVINCIKFTNQCVHYCKLSNELPKNKLVSITSDDLLSYIDYDRVVRNVSYTRLDSDSVNAYRISNTNSLETISEANTTLM